VLGRPGRMAVSAAIARGTICLDEGFRTLFFADPDGVELVNCGGGLATLVGCAACAFTSLIEFIFRLKESL
jgi:hypothetical protein